MSQRRLHEVLVELEQELRAADAIDPEDRALVEQVRAELHAVLSAPPSAPRPPDPEESLRERIRDALDRVQANHPALSRLMTATLDALNDLGV